MKKILILVASAFCLMSSAFALDLEVGVKGDLGKNIASDVGLKDAVTSISTSDDFQFGGSAYVHASIFGLGVQIEPTIFKSTVNFGGVTLNDAKKGQITCKETVYDSLVLDIPVMAWYNYNFWKFSIGAGAGVDFSTDLNRNDGYLNQIKNAGVELYNNPTNFAWAFICGADAKFYITDSIGIVGSARYLMDFTKRDVPVNVDVNGYTVETGASYPTIEYARKFLYGSIGLEFKFF